MTIRERLIRWLGGVPAQAGLPAAAEEHPKIEFRTTQYRRIETVRAEVITNAYDIPAADDAAVNDRIRRTLTEQLADALFLNGAVTVKSREEFDCTSGPGTFRITAEVEVVR